MALQLQSDRLQTAPRHLVSPTPSRPTIQTTQYGMPFGFTRQ